MIIECGIWRSVVIAYPKSATSIRTNRMVRPTPQLDLRIRPLLNGRLVESYHSVNH